MTTWVEATHRLIAALESRDAVWRPTHFWAPGTRRLTDDLATRGIETFKSWPTAPSWFYPLYGNGFTEARIAKIRKRAHSLNPYVRDAWLTSVLNGSLEARRDFDAAQLAWDQERWPFDLTEHSESSVGKPPQRYRLTGRDEHGWGRAYLNYLLCLAALSRHVTEPPRSFLEIGGGFGVLGEIVTQRDPEARYVDADIPPLLSVAHYYLSEVVGADRVLGPDDVGESGAVEVPGVGVLPNWRLPDLRGPFDAFVNSFSFQEMEPDVVEHYVGLVAGLGVRHAVSLNSVEGKPRAVDGKEGGVLDPVTSSRIVGMFERRGYRAVATYREPLIISAGEIVVLERG